MKTIFKTLIFLLAFTACKAQTISNIENNYKEPRSQRAGKYYTDLDNLFDKYVGTWLYSIGTTSLKVKLIKVSKEYITHNNYYRDVLIGEYEYIENGVVKVSTLSQLNNTTSTFNHNMINSLILKPYEYPVCIDCDEMVKRISIHFNDPQRKYLGYRCYMGLTEDAVPKLVFHLAEDEGLLIPQGAPEDRRVPTGHYILTKQ